MLIKSLTPLLKGHRIKDKVANRLISEFKGDRTINTINLLKSLIAILPFIRQKIRKIAVFSRKFRKKLRKNSKGLINDPIFYFGVFSVIFLSGIFLSFPEIPIKSLPEWDFSFLKENNLTKAAVENLFIEPAKNIIRESPEMTFFQQNTAIGLVPPVISSNQVLASLIDGEELGVDMDRRSITEYAALPGDSLSSIAEKFNISLNTILWANDLSKGSDIRIGQKLVIPPVSGIIYHIKKGDTLSEIASKYKGEVNEIIAFNELLGENDIYVGDILIIPNGKMPTTAKPTYIAVPQVPVGSSYFICPRQDCLITQGLHWYNAVDFKGECGSPIVAAAGGIVQRVKYGWNQGAGNYLAVLHPNGIVTTYGHIMNSLVEPGQQVSQGQIIALVGGKPGMPGAGISTGCHVHFGVIGARNPFAR